MSILFHGGRHVWDERFAPMPVRVMSTFSGIGAASISWRPNEFVPLNREYIPLFDFIAYAEIDPFPCHVLDYRRGASRPKYMPDPLEKGLCQKERKRREKWMGEVSGLPESGTINFGDIRQITDEDLRRLGPVDVLEGGSPCQAFSVAGARKGLADPRGNLMLAFCQLAERMRVINGLQYVVWENVHGVLSDKTNGFGCLLASLAGEQGGPLQPPGKRWSNAGRVLGPEGRRVAWRTIQAAHWGVPQRRKRVFAVANLGAAFNGVSTPYEILFESESSGWHPRKGLQARQAVVATYRRGDCVEYRSAEDRYRDKAVRDRLEAEASQDWIGRGLTAASSLAADKKSGLRDSPSTATRNKVSGAIAAPAPRQIVLNPSVSGTLCARAAPPIGVSSEHNFVVIIKDVGDDDPETWAVRHFTPLECERLQGFPDYWTDVPFKGQLATDSQRYKAIGNSMACPVMAYIGHFLELAMDMQSSFETFSPWETAPGSKRRGRPPKNGVAMSAAERQRRRRERLRQERSSQEIT